MEEILPISDLQTKTKKIIDSVKNTKEAVIITQRGRPAAMIVNYDDYKSMVHTLDEMSYPDWQERLFEAEKDSQKGKGLSLAKLKDKINRVRGCKK